MSVNPWIRLYRESLHDPKIVTLSDKHHRAWHNFLLCANDRGVLPSLRDLASHLRMSCTDCEQVILDLVEAELVDAEVINGVRVYTMHGWAKRQYVSDSSTERSRKFRAQRPCNVAATSPQRPQTTDSDSESKIVTSEQEAPRAKKQFVDLKFGKAKSGSGPKTVRERAEGLGVPVDELAATTDRAKPRNPEAYFRRLCINWLRQRIPNAAEPLIDKALTGEREAWTLVTLAMLEAPACH